MLLSSWPTRQESKLVCTDMIILVVNKRFKSSPWEAFLCWSFTSLFLWWFPLLCTMKYICDVKAISSLLQCSNCATPSQPLSGEIASHHTSNTGNQARLDISAKGWNTYRELVLLLMWEFLIQLLYESHSHFHLVITKKWSVSMRKEFAMLNMEHLLHLFFLLGAWDPLQLHFTDVWPPFCLINYISLTICWFCCHLSFSLLSKICDYVFS